MIAGLMGVLAATAQAQVRDNWVTMTQYKTEPGKSQDFRKWVETTWVKFAQAAVDEGANNGSMMVRLTMPFVTGAPADYAVITFPKGRPSIGRLDWAKYDARAKKAGYQGYQQMLDQVQPMAKAVRTDWMVFGTRVGTIQAGNYLRTMRYMVGASHRQAVGKFLRDYSTAQYTARVKEGNIQGFGIGAPGVVTPEEAGWTYSLSIIHKDASTAMEGPPQMSEEWFKKVFPGKSYANYIRQLDDVIDLRKPVTTRLYEVVAIVGAPPQVDWAPEQ
jgi:hypothetical protein